MQLYLYDIPLHPCPLPLTARRGALVRTEIGWGEIAPLPGFSPETLDEALATLSTPAAAFGLASARIPFPTAYPAIPLSALVSTREEAERAIALGFSTLKIKVKTLLPRAALALVDSLRHPTLRLRIDVNRQWNFEEACLFCRALDPAGIEYIEEPVDDPRAIPALPPCRIALDETLLEPCVDALLDDPHVTALVLKPTLLGKSLFRFLPLAKTLSFSSSFESAIGLLHIAHLQARYAPTTAVGLDTHRSFQHNFLPFPVENGRLCPTPLPPIDTKWLTPR